ncbi:MAG: PilZ domain-containing protein [Gammaproteobacteria bacterium]
MLTYNEKRNEIRMKIDCDLTYKFACSLEIFHGRCTSISGSGVSFITDRGIAQGKALEITVGPNDALAPSMRAFIEVLRNTRKADNSYEIAASIKSIKGN